MLKINHPIVGAVTYEPRPGYKIRLPRSFTRKIKTVLVPQLKGVPTYGMDFDGEVPFYESAIPQLLAAWRAVERAGLLHRVIFWGGSWVPRMKRGSKTSPSEHTWGCAFDINPDQNGFRSTPAAKGEKGYLRDIAQIFKAYGFEWGGDWRSPDGMHFQIRRILSAAEIAALEGKAIVPTRVKPIVVAPKIIEPKLVIIRNINGKQKRFLISSSALKNKQFEVDEGELAGALFVGNRGSARDFMKRFGIKPYDENDLLAKEGRYEVYV